MTTIEDATVLSVPFLGEVGGLAVALVVTADHDDSGEPIHQVVALSGPASQPVRSWEQHSSPVPDTSTEPVHALSAALGRGGQVRAVVVAKSDVVSAAYSPRPDIDPGGTVVRRFTVIPLANGVGTAVWQGAPAAATLRVQEKSGRPAIDSFGVSGGLQAEAQPQAQAEAASCRGSAFADLRLNLVNVATGATERAGRDPGEVAEVRGVWCRRVARHALMLVGVRLTDGTALQTVLEEVDEDSGQGFPVHDGWAVPVGRAATNPPSSPCPTSTTRRAGSSRAPLRCSAPAARPPSWCGTAAGDVVLLRAQLSADGAGVGTASTRLPGTTAGSDLFVVVRDRAGHELERAPVPLWDDVWGTNRDGPVTRG